MSLWEYWTRYWLLVLRRFEDDGAEILRQAEARRERHCATVADLDAEREKRRLRA